MDVASYLVKSKVTSEFKSVTKGLGLDEEDDKSGDEERRRREAENELRKQESKNQAKMRQIEADHSKKREEREKKRDEIRNKYGIGESAPSTTKQGGKKDEGKCVIS